ncbi:MAG: hypothetical protein A3G87_07730 [Omnitrophica bacterium RIFCSPLOWO2_12_FULL_50_11]|nr:MAG: hypothetical protein A3G87_07730 [Omnitrophica bacterium RIFCSPLOWO2_12_FULL_50_11]
MVHKNGIERADFFADTTVHADREIYVKGFWAFEGPALFIVIAHDRNTFGRTLFGANVARHTAQVLRLVIVNQKWEIPKPLFLG